MKIRPLSRRMENFLFISIVLIVVLVIPTIIVAYTYEEKPSSHQQCRVANGQWVDGPATRPYCIYPRGY